MTGSSIRLSTPPRLGRLVGDRRRVDEAHGAGEVGVDLEGHDAAVALHHAQRDRVIGMAREARVPDVLDLGMGLEVAGEGHAVRVVALHADVEGLDAAQQEPGGVAVDDAAEDAERLAHGVDHLLRAGQRAGEQVVVPAEVLRRAVQHEVGAVGERACG